MHLAGIFVLLLLGWSMSWDIFFNILILYFRSTNMLSLEAGPLLKNIKLMEATVT